MLGFNPAHGDTLRYVSVFNHRPLSDSLNNLLLLVHRRSTDDSSNSSAYLITSSIDYLSSSPSASSLSSISSLQREPMSTITRQSHGHVSQTLTSSSSGAWSRCSGDPSFSSLSNG
ncbi:hypothetical protein ACOME3_000142 [Neoechinorhynchus agilis]